VWFFGYLYNKVYIFIVRSCHGIIIFVGLESASFHCYLEKNLYLLLL
jgi:hypothetical protein